MNIIPVIHYSNDSQAIFNASLAAKYGCYGVFLIDMVGDQATNTFNCAYYISDLFPSLKVGMNHLSHNPQNDCAKNISAGLSMTWTDKCITHSQISNTSIQQEIAMLLKSNPHHLFFGGVAFKYQPYEPSPAQAALDSYNLNIIPTTSGTHTGQSASIEHIQTVRSMLPNNAPLAVASGISSDNIQSFKNLLNYALVATSIIKDKDNELFDDELLMQLMRHNSI